MSIFRVVEIPMTAVIAVTGVEVGPRMATEKMEDIGKEVLAPEDVKLLRMQIFRFPAEIPEMFRMFKSSSWNNWIETSFRGWKTRCVVVESRSRSCSSILDSLFKLSFADRYWKGFMVLQSLI